MKQICVFLLFVTAVLGKPQFKRDESTSFQVSADGFCVNQESCAYCDINIRSLGCHHPTVQNKCKRSCGLCPGACQDNNSCSWCNYNKQRGNCDNPEFSKDCRFTCNICSGK